jgi:hypothetical protein
VAQKVSPANTLNIELTAFWSCTYPDGGVLFTETFTNTNSGVQSARVGVTCNL